MVNTKSPVFLFIGSDSYLKEKAIKDLTSSLLGESPQDLDRKVFYGGEASPGEVLDHVNTTPFLASRRLVIIRDLEKSSSELMDCLKDYIKKPSQSTCLILESSDDSVLKDCAGISDYANVRKFDGMAEHQVAAWIADLLAARGKKIDISASELLREMHGQNLLALTQELEKLAVFVGRRAEIGPEDVENIVGKSLVSSAFDLADAIGSKKTASALRICRDLMVSGRKEYEIIGLLCWHFKRLLKAKTLLERGDNDSRITYTMRIAQKHRAAFFRQVSGLSTEQIKAGIRSLLDADLDIKRTRFDYAHSNLVLEFAIIKLSKNFA